MEICFNTRFIRFICYLVLREWKIKAMNEEFEYILFIGEAKKELLWLWNQKWQKKNRLQQQQQEKNIA